MEIKYSKYIKTRTRKWDKARGNLKMFKNKSLKDWKKTIDLKAICAATRYLTCYTMENIENNELKNKIIDKCKESILHSNDIVEHIRNYKKDFDKDWWNEEKVKPKDNFGWNVHNTWVKHKSFGKPEEEIAYQLLKIDDNIASYNVIREIYNLTNIEEVKKTCKLIIWMTYKIDQRCIYYENKVI